MKEKVTVIIPARNEEKNIKNVIEIARRSLYTSEIIVVNNNSLDNTKYIAEKNGAIVIDCEEIGKGNAMKEGLKKASNEILVFLDADVLNYKDDIIELLTLPIIEEKAEFVKSTFNRITGGKVTEIAVKPLLKILYPNLYGFQEPLSGMIACKKAILEKVDFDSDYGVDIGIVLDIYNMKIKMKEVNIGEIINMSHEAKTTEKMQQMSYEVMKAIIKRSK